MRHRIPVAALLLADEALRDPGRVSSLRVLAIVPIVAKWSAERGLLSGVALFIVGVLIGIVQVIRWGSLDFGPQDAAEVVRIAIPSALGIILGFQTIFMSFFSGVLTIPRRETSPEAIIES